MFFVVLVALGFIVAADVNPPVVNPTPQVKSVTSTLESTKAVTPKAKPKKKVVKKEVAKVDSMQQNTTKDLAKSQPVKQESTNVSSSEQKTNQINLLYYILGFLTLGLITAYFYFKNKNKQLKPNDTLYTSNELNKTLEQPQQPSTPDPTSNSNEDVKK